MPRFLYKNQTAGRSPPPVTIPLFRNDPALCPVVALRMYLARTADLPHRDFVFIHPSSSASLVAGRLNYWVVQAVSAANVRGSVIRAHDVRKFAFSVNWARLRICRIYSRWVLGVGSPFSLALPYCMSFSSPQFCGCGVSGIDSLGFWGLPMFCSSYRQVSVLGCGVFCNLCVFP